MLSMAAHLFAELSEGLAALAAAGAGQADAAHARHRNTGFSRSADAGLDRLIIAARGLAGSRGIRVRALFVVHCWLVSLGLRAATPRNACWRFQSDLNRGASLQRNFLAGRMRPS